VAAGILTSELHRQRLAAVLEVIRSSGARTVLDLGCGDGAFLIRLVREPGIERVVGVEFSAAALKALRDELGQAPPEIARKAELIQGSVTEPLEELTGFDAAVLVEVIEHVEPHRLSLVERAVFGRLAPTTIVVTTPNADFNAFLGVPNHRFRHPDHRFEWGRDRFRSWAGGVGRRNGYQVAFADVEAVHPVHGGPTQMAVFRRNPADCRPPA
jgi:small RNA 2'-O-methyltransferase